MALQIRKTCINRIKNKCGDFIKSNFINTIDDIVDISVFNSSGLRLTGSRKGHFINQANAKEFVDEGRPYNLLLTLKENEKNTEYFNNLKSDLSLLINKTSIISTEEYITNIMNNPNLEDECGECDSDTENYDNDLSIGNWNKVPKDNIRHIAILRFFSKYVKDYSIRDIKRIFCSDNEKIYILCSQSKYCLNIGRNHNSEHIYFILNKDGICQKCFCRCDTMKNRQFGYCKDFKSEVIPISDHYKKVLNFQDNSKKNIENESIKTLNKKSSDENLNCITNNLMDNLYNQFTNKDTGLGKKKGKASNKR